MPSSSGTSTPLRGWALLLSPLPDAAKTTLHASIYNTSGLTDVNEGYLWERLHNSGFKWSWEIVSCVYHGSEQRTGKNGAYTVHMATAVGNLRITDDDGVERVFGGASGSDNRRLDASMKGACTGAFKQANKYLGQMMELYKGKAIIDQLYEVDGQVVGAENGSQGSTQAPATAAPTPLPTPPPAPPATGPSPEAVQAIKDLLGSIDDEAVRKDARTAAARAIKANGNDGLHGVSYLLELHEKIHGDCLHAKAVRARNLWREDKAAA